VRPENHRVDATLSQELGEDPSAVLCCSLSNHGDVVQALGNGRLTLSCQGDHRIGQIEQCDDARGLRIICPQNSVARLLEEPAVSDVFHVLPVEELACDGRTERLGDEFVGRGIVRRCIVDGQTLAAVSHPIVQRADCRIRIGRDAEFLGS